MAEKEKLEKLKKLADGMYYAAQNLTTNASRLHKAMDEYHKFIIQEWRNEEPISGELKKVDLDKEIDKWYNNEASKEFENVVYEDIEKYAKHFFELGLKA